MTWACFEEETMNTLVYRGHTYDQQRSLSHKPTVLLTYRRHVYQAHQAEARRSAVELKYRDVTYTH